MQLNQNMQVFRIKSESSLEEIDKKLANEQAVVLSLNSIESMEEIKLAEYLAKKSFKNKKNIAKKFKYEFLLWLSGKRDIKSALENTKPKENKMFIVIFSESKNILKKLGITSKAAGLKKRADPLTLERISLSRII